eukprot:COSAG01_NODE_2150_length_8295_cov_54.415447_2_plen_153_part_00
MDALAAAESYGGSDEAKAKKFRQLRPLDALMDITTYVGELQRDFFRDAEQRVSHNADGVAMTEYLEEEYECEKRRASTLYMVGVPDHQPWAWYPATRSHSEPDISGGRHRGGARTSTNCSHDVFIKAPSAVCADLLQPKRSARHPGAGGEAF